MGDSRYKRCRYCRRTREEVGELSWTRQCQTCWESRINGNMEGMLTMRGPFAAHWRRQMAACVGAVIPDDAWPT